MIKRFLLPVSVAAMLMSGMIGYSKQQVLADTVPEETIQAVLETKEAGEVLTAKEYLQYGDFNYTVDNKGDVTICGLIDPNKSSNINIFIPSQINGMPVKYIGDSAFKDNTAIKSVELSEGLVQIGTEAFYGCINITGTLYIPSTVTDIQGGGKYSDEGGAFQKTSLNEVVIAEGNEALTIGNNVFRSCKALQKVTLSGSLTSIGQNCFYGDMSLETVNFAKEGQPLTIEKYAFYSTVLTTLELPDTVTKVGEGAFGNCKSLEKAVMGSNVKSIGFEAFKNDTALTVLKLNEGLETIGAGAFRSCSSLSGTLVIPSTVTEIEEVYEWSDGGAFEETAIEEVVFKEGSEALDIGNHTFRNCSKLTKVKFPARLKRVGNYAFDNCTVLKDVEFISGDNSLTIEKYAFEETAVEEVVFPLNTAALGEWSFRNCASLTDVTFNEGLSIIAQGAFINCKNLKCDIVIPSTVILIDGGYSWDDDGAFQNTGIKSLTIKDGNAGITIGCAAFKDCTNLRYAELSNRVSEINDKAFANDYKLAWVRISNGVYEAKIGRYVFANATYLKALVIPKMCDIDEEMLENCTKLKDIYYASKKADYKNYVKAADLNTVYNAAEIHYESQGPDTMPDITYTGGDIVGEKKFWYEGDVLQGYDADDESYRGKEIYDPESDAWYWCDNIQGGAIAVSKDVYQESYAGEYADNKEAGTGKWVRYDENGHMIKGFDTNENGTYYFDPVYGAMVKGLQKIDGVLYYFDPVTGIMQSGNISVDGVEYAFNSDGTGVDQSWYTIDGQQYWYENGVRQGYKKGDLSYRGKEIYDSKSDAWYWLDNVQGGAKAAGKDVFQESNGGKWVRYDKYGKMIKGWSKVSYGQYNYFDLETGAMYKGWHTIDGKDYYFDENTGITSK